MNSKDDEDIENSILIKNTAMDDSVRSKPKD